MLVFYADRDRRRALTAVHATRLARAELVDPAPSADGDGTDDDARATFLLSVRAPDGGGDGATPAVFELCAATHEEAARWVEVLELARSEAAAPPSRGLLAGLFG